MAVKTRDITRKVTFSGGFQNGTPKEPIEQVWKGRQYTVSEGHVKSRDGRYHAGGPFYSARAEVDIKTTHVNLSANGGLNKYSGPCCVALVPNTASGGDAPGSDAYLDPIGAEAISAVDPTNPNAQTGVALGEILRDRKLPIPAIQAWRRRTEVAKAAGSEYLNAVFGWMPLVNDMKNTAQSVLDGNLILQNYQNASGTNVHREFAFPDIESRSESIVGSTIPNIGKNILGLMNVRPVTRSRVSKTRRWFSGSFTYHANSDNNSFRKCLGYGSDADKLFGVSLSPDLVWELTPWSWAIDWFSNAQSVIHNVGAFELAGLVMRYGFIMEETSTVDTYSMPNDCFVGRSIPIPPSVVTSTVKRRKEANPFGFGLQWEGLSPTQLAITAALGITRLR